MDWYCLSLTLLAAFAVTFSLAEWAAETLGAETS